jgi:hypothetical protein
MPCYPSQEDYDALLRTGLFLPDWYVAEHGASLPKGVDPLMDFCVRGWQVGHAPNPYFDCRFYLRENADIREADINPLLHYLYLGEAEGRRPTACFDPAWYRARHDVRGDENSLAHFLRHRFTGRASPTADFDPIAYLRLRPALRAGGMDPFLHWLAAPDAALPSEEDIVVMSGLFDPSFYLLCNPDVRAAGQDPLDHFFAYGKDEARNPNLYFDMRYRMERAEASTSAYTNPVAQYYAYGETKGERPGPYFDPLWYARTYGLEPCDCALHHYLTHRRSQFVSPNADFDVRGYVALQGASIGRNRDPFAHYLRTRR